MAGILVVDHHEKKRQWLIKILAEAGYEVVCAPDGESGQKVFQAQKPAACVLTMTLPRISGSELCVKLKATGLGRRTPIVLTSNVFKNMNLEKIARSRWKVDAFLEEPYSKEQLLLAIAAQIEIYSKQASEVETPEEEKESRRARVDEEIDPFGYVDEEALDVLDAAMAAADIASEGMVQIESERAAKRTAEARARRPARSSTLRQSLKLGLEESGAARPAPAKQAPAPLGAGLHAPPEPRAPAGTMSGAVKESRLGELMVEPEGDLGETSFPELLAALFFARVTGVLSVGRPAPPTERGASAGIEKTVFLREGLPLQVQGDVREETLGRILEKHGLIDEETLHRSLKDMAARDMRQGDALIDIGALTSTQLYKALRLQAREKLLSIFTWHEGPYRFEEKEFDTREMTTFEMWPPSLILQGILRYYDAATIREIAGEMKEFVLKRREDPPVAFGALRFPPEVEPFFALMDGRRTVAEMIKDSPLDSTRTYQVFYALLVLEQFDKIDPGEMAESPQEELPETSVSLDRLAQAALAEAKTAPPLQAGPHKDHARSVAAAADFAEEMLPDLEEAAPLLPPPRVHAGQADRAGHGAGPEEELERLLAKKDAESGKWSEEASISGRVTFDLDEEEGGEEMMLEEEASPARAHLAIPKSTPRTQAPKEEDRLSEELSRTLDSFLEDVEREGEIEPDILEETVHLILEEGDLAAREGGESTEEAEAVSAEVMKAARLRRGFRPPESYGGRVGGQAGVSEKTLSEEDTHLLEAILSDYLALPKANHYTILHVPASADGKAVRDAYTMKVKRFHPDKLQGRFSTEVVKKANDVMARATEAYHTLSDHKRRTAYNQQLAIGGEKKERSVQMILAAENEFNMGLSAVKQHAWQEAKRHFTKAVEMFPEEGEYHAHLGWSIYNLTDQPLGERTNEARTFMEKAIRLNPRSDKSYYFLGMLLKDNNFIDKAALMFAQAYRYNKNNHDAKNQLKAIQMLRMRRPAVQRKKAKSAKDLLSTDISVESVKKAILKIFW